MQSYLCSSQIASMLDAIIDYADTGSDYGFENDKMQMIWDDIKPDVKRSRESYQKWLADRMAEESERIKVNRESKVRPIQKKKTLQNYIGRIEDLDKEENLPF